MKPLLGYILAILFFSTAYGQGEFTLYNLNQTVPQAHQLNPAFRPKAKVIIGLPVISSTHMSVDMDQLSFNQVFTESIEQSLSLNAENISGLLRDKNNFSIQSDLQLFFLGLNLGNNFFSLAINDRVNSWMVYTKDIANLALFGNGDDRTFGKNLSLDHLLLRQNLYHEIALGYAKTIQDKLSIGARIKFLSGVLNAQTDQVNGYIRTDMDSIHITNSSFAFRNSGYNYFTEDLDILSMYRNTLPFTNGNSGFGLDLGVQYQITDRINLSASVSDVGYINWKENTQSYSFDNVTYSFKGFDVIDLIRNDGVENNFFQNELDSLENLLTPQELENIAYKSSLVSNFYSGIDYKLGQNHHVGAQVYGKMAEGNITPEFGAYYNLKLGQVVNAVVNASFRNGKIHAAGVGASIDLGPIQLYGATESVTSLINPQAANMLDARVGINLLFGKKKKAKELVAEHEEEIEEEIEDANELAEIPDDITSKDAITPETNLVPQTAVAVVPVSTPEVETPDDFGVEEEVMELPEIIEEPKVVVVKQGNHKDELELGHYIVVGAFLSRDNAQKYSNSLKAKGFNNQFGFLTEKDFYYVTVYKNIGDIEKAREVRNEYRKRDDFLFPDTWLLSVVE